MTPKSRREIGEKIAALVWAAEKKFPQPRSGVLKFNWVIKQAAREAPQGPGPSVEFARYAGNQLLRIGIEIAVSLLNRIRADLPNDGSNRS